jgi:hypothetical protein
MNTTITMKSSATGLNLTLCYKHRDEPWTAYDFFTNDVRMIHNISTLFGDFNNSVSDQPKVRIDKDNGFSSPHNQRDDSYQLMQSSLFAACFASLFAASPI